MGTANRYSTLPEGMKYASAARLVARLTILAIADARKNRSRTSAHSQTAGNCRCRGQNHRKTDCRAHQQCAPADLPDIGQRLVLNCFWRMVKAPSASSKTSTSGRASPPATRHHARPKRAQQRRQRCRCNNAPVEYGYCAHSARLAVAVPAIALNLLVPNIQWLAACRARR